MERLTSEQIRLLEELRELRDSGILTVDEFEFQVAKVLGRQQAVEPSLVDQELVMPDETAAEEISDDVMLEEQDVDNDVPAASDGAHESELLEYEFVEPNVSDEEEILAEENQGIETLPVSDNTASSDVESEPQQDKSSRRKVLIGTTVGLILIVVALVALGGGKSDSTSSQIIDSTTIVTQRTIAATTQTPTTSTTTTTEVIPTTIYEVLQCPYTRVIEAVDGKIMTPEGITISPGDEPLNFRPSRDGRGFHIPWSGPAAFRMSNSTDLRIRADVAGFLVVDERKYGFNLSWGYNRLVANGFEQVDGIGPYDLIVDELPITRSFIELTQATIEYRCA